MKLTCQSVVCLQPKRMLLRGQGCGPGTAAERKGSALQASLGGGMRYPAALAVHVLSAETRGDFEDGEYETFRFIKGTILD